MLSALFALKGHTCSIAYNGREGLEILERETFDGILLDLWMPLVNGWEFLEKLKHPVPVIVVSCAADTAMGVPAIRKPYDFPELLKLVQSTFGGVHANPHP